MHKKHIIRQIAASALLLLILVSSSSTQLLHDIFANHKDYTTGITHTSNSDQVMQQAFHCQLDNFVIELPFIKPANLPGFILEISHPEYICALATAIPPAFPSFLALRGPPVLS